MDSHLLPDAGGGSDAVAELPTAPTDAELLVSINAFMARHPEMKRTRFGLDAMGEGNLIKSLEDGRSLSLKNTNRVLAFMREFEAAKASEQANAMPSDTASGLIQSATKADEIIRHSADRAGEAESHRPFAPIYPTSSPTSAQSPSSPGSQGCSAGGEAEAA